MKQVNWGIIGCGDVTEVKSGPAFNRIPGSSLVAVMRRTPGLARDYALRHGVDRWYEDAGQLIDDPCVNAIYVATPPSTHSEYAMLAMKAGKPVYVEKPMASSFEECDAMAKASARLGVPLFIAYYRPFMPYFIKVKEIIDSGVLGRIEQVNLQFAQKPRQADFDSENLPWRVVPSISGGGYFYDMASHQLNLLASYFGFPISISGLCLHKKKLYPAEDTVMAVMEFSKGIRFSGSWDFVAEEEESDFIELMGSEGKLRFSSFRFTPIEVLSKSGLEIFNVAKDDTVQFHLIQKIVRELHGFEKCNADLQMAVHTNLVMDTILGKLLK
jgi:predicted dehydrogenase